MIQSLANASGVISDVFSHGVVAFLYVIERCCFSPTMKNEETKALWEDLRMSHLCLRTPFLLYLVCCLCHLDVYTTQHKYGWQCQRQSGQDLEWVGRKLTVSLAGLSDPWFSQELIFLDFPAGPQVKNLPGNVGDIDLILGPGKFHVPQGNWAHVPQLLKLTCLEPVLSNKRSHRQKKKKRILKLLDLWKVKVKSLTCVQLFEIPWTVAYQAPPSMEFSRQEYLSGLPFPSPEDLPDPGIEPRSPALWADTLPSDPP